MPPNGKADVVPTPPATEFSIFRNRETLGKWNIGATEILEASGLDRTIYFSGLHAIEVNPGEGPRAMFPQDFASQCGYVQGKLKAALAALGGAADNIVRSTSFVTGDIRQPDSAKCRAQLPKEEVVRAPGTLANVQQLGYRGQTFTYDIVAMMPKAAGPDDSAFSRKDGPSEIDGHAAASVTVSGPRRTLYVSGVGAQDDKDDSVQFKGDFQGQCRAALQKLGRYLASQNASLSNVVKLLVFATDSRYFSEYQTCMDDTFGKVQQPAQTFVNVSRLPAPGMLFQVDAVAVAPLR